MLRAREIYQSFASHIKTRWQLPLCMDHKHECVGFFTDRNMITNNIYAHTAYIPLHAKYPLRIIFLIVQKIYIKSRNIPSQTNVIWSGNRALKLNGYHSWSTQISNRVWYRLTVTQMLLMSINHRVIVHTPCHVMQNSQLIPCCIRVAIAWHTFRPSHEWTAKNNGYT